MPLEWTAMNFSLTFSTNKKEGNTLKTLSLLLLLLFFLLLHTTKGAGYLCHIDLGALHLQSAAPSPYAEKMV